MSISSPSELHWRRRMEQNGELHSWGLSQWAKVAVDTRPNNYLAPVKDTEMCSLKQDKDIHWGLSLSRLGRAGQRWGRSLLGRLPATACRQKNSEITSTKLKKKKNWIKRNKLLIAHLTWLKEATSVTSNVIITTGERENIRSIRKKRAPLLVCFHSQWEVSYPALLCNM